ncbi:LOW QUALITY PROTEIN: hypothetical protein U9M48_041616 [Paspalum notatum var. saurae]|uniref:F-box domain-containing protein n=1 Tax=Paspalum notatum var. saurae TaxID=547442 RepID=A0AAQ3UPF6_PASNO
MDRPETKRGAAGAGPSLFLPDGAVEEILDRVPAKSLCRFKRVSKCWRGLISDLLRRKKLPQTLEGFFYDACSGDGYDGSSPCSSRGVSPTPWLPPTECIALLDSCNGLLLFGHKRILDDYCSLGYIVCNTATKQWVSVPSSGWTPCEYSQSSDSEEEDDSDTEPGDFTITYLIFDSAVSSHFQLVQFGMDWASCVGSCCTYSSETGVWSEVESEWNFYDGSISVPGSAFVCGMLHLSTTRADTGQPLIVAVDGEGRKCRIMSWSEAYDDLMMLFSLSQGRLHYGTQPYDNNCDTLELCVWVLEGYEAEEWVLKHRVSLLQLLGRIGCRVAFDYGVVAIHPYCSVLYFVQHWDGKLKSYDMDSKEVCTLCSLGQVR